MGFFEKLKEGLAKTKNAFVSQVDNLFKSFVKVDEELFDELEELLICADIGVGATEEILDKLGAEGKDYASIGGKGCGKFGNLKAGTTVGESRVLFARSDEKAKMAEFDAIRAAQIAEALAAKGVTVDRKNIEVAPVKEVGKYNAKINLHKEVSVELPFEVVAE